MSLPFLTIEAKKHYNLINIILDQSFRVDEMYQITLLDPSYNITTVLFPANISANILPAFPPKRNK